MAATPEVFVEIDADSFAIESVKYQPQDDDNGVVQSKQSVPNFQVGGRSIDNLYDLSSPIFESAVAAILEHGTSKLKYHIDGDSTKEITLETIEGSAVLRCGFQQFLSHDPVFCEFDRRREDRKSFQAVYHKYEKLESKTAEYAQSFSAATFDDLKSSILAVGFFENQATAYSVFVNTLGSVEDPFVHEQYLVTFTYDEEDEVHLGAVVLMVEPTFELEMCLPIRAK